MVVQRCCERVAQFSSVALGSIWAYPKGQLVGMRRGVMRGIWKYSVLVFCT